MGMAEPRRFLLGSVTTDGWFEDVAEQIGSFQTLCEIIGERFFAFSLVSGAKITALTVDRQDPDETLVEFLIGDDPDQEASEADVQKVPLGQFRRQLVSALTVPEPTGPAPERATDVEGIQRFLGLRALLLAPLFGYRLLELLVPDAEAPASKDAAAAANESILRVEHDGVEQRWPVETFRSRIRSHVREELRKVMRAADRRGLLDMSRVDDAAEAAAKGEHRQVAELLGAWPSPLSVLLRTPEGQLLGSDAKATLARGLTLLGISWSKLGQTDRGEDVLRLAVQYAGDHPIAAEVFLGLGEALAADGRSGEAIGHYRRAANLGADGARVWPRLASAFIERHRFLAALGAVLEAEDAGVVPSELAPFSDAIRQALGSPLGDWAELSGATLPSS